MKYFILLCVLHLQFCWSYGYPSGQEGVGAYAYQDSTGNRYGGTYNLKDGKVVKTSGDVPIFDGDKEGRGEFPGFGGYNPSGGDYSGFGGYQPFFGGDFPFADMFEPEQFFPAYFRNLENLLEEAFKSNVENQKTALSAAQKALDLTSNQASDDANFMSRFRPFGFPMVSGDNSAIASAAAGPGFSRQMGQINPANPDVPNYDISERSNDAGPGHYRVSSSSYSSSANIGGKQISNRGAETLVDNNGMVSHYAVHS